MKTTIDLPDELYRQAKATAALDGRKLKDLVEEGLRRVLDVPRKGRRQRSLAALIAEARGAMDSGVPDLSSNPRHLKGFGRDAGNRLTPGRWSPSSTARNAVCMPEAIPDTTSIVPNSIAVNGDRF